MTAESENRSALPTEVDLSSIPRFARVAFAARCARRIQPLFEVLWPDAPEEYSAIIDRSIRIAEESAAGGRLVQAEEDKNCSQDVWAVAREAGNEGEPAAACVAKAAWAAAKDSTAANVVFSLNVCLSAARQFGRNATGQAIRNDFERVRDASIQNRWEDSTPVSVAFFGPFWPEGPPADWPFDVDESELIAAQAAIETPAPAPAPTPVPPTEVPEQVAPPTVPPPTPVQPPADHTPPPAPPKVAQPVQPAEADEVFQLQQPVVTTPPKPAVAQPAASVPQPRMTPRQQPPKKKKRKKKERERIPNFEDRNPAVAAAISRKPSFLRSLITSTLASAFLGALIGLAFSAPISMYYGHPSLTDPAAWDVQALVQDAKVVAETVDWQDQAAVLSALPQLATPVGVTLSATIITGLLGFLIALISAPFRMLRSN